MKELKYYFYVSQPKVDMLYAQMPISIRTKIEAEVKLNLQLAEISFSKKQFSDNIYTKLSSVINYLDKENLVGSIGEPLEYFRGNFHMGWAQIYPGVLFLGCIINDISVGLGGSMNNLLGYQWNPTDVPVGISHTPWLVSLLYKEVKMHFPFDPAFAQYGHFDVKATRKEESERRVASATGDWAYEMSNFPGKYHIGKFEFVAKVLRKTKRITSIYKEVLLGTPIYVAKI